MRKHRLFYSFILSTGILAFTTIMPVSQNMAFADNSIQKTINVSGEGKISVSPDVAYINIGVQSQKNSVMEAQAENAETLEKVYAVLDQAHIKKEDIQTVSFNVNPMYTWDQNKQVFQGYQVTHILRVTDRNLAEVGQLLDSVTKAGANRVDNISFDTEKREQYQLKALDLAMDDASQKATYLAGKIGQSIQSIISIHDNGGASVPTPSFQSLSKATADGVPTQVSGGVINISASVDVSYGF
jgi:uncharacterized protein YggE